MYSYVRTKNWQWSCSSLKWVFIGLRQALQHFFILQDGLLERGWLQSKIDQWCGRCMLMTLAIAHAMFAQLTSRINLVVRKLRQLSTALHYEMKDLLVTSFYDQQFSTKSRWIFFAQTGLLDNILETAIFSQQRIWYSHYHATSYCWLEWVPFFWLVGFCIHYWNAPLLVWQLLSRHCFCSS